jgi:crotonobetainyl-CoA:carnitine CoA-transferase CaiB-like acyl-CoA transferase
MYQNGPLEGVRILDFTHVLAGPFTTVILGDLGAEILKVEPPGRGDSTRLSGPPFQNGESAYFISFNRNKKSLCIDLKKKDGVEIIKRLIKDCDVLVESFRLGVMERLGLGYEEMVKINPNIIYASLNAFGTKGPYKDRPGFELIIQGLTGLVNITTEPDRKPFKIQIQVVDLCAGMFLSIAVLAALYHRERTGQAQRVETSLLESTIAMLANLAGIFFMTGKVPVGLGSRNPQVMPSQAFKTKDSYVVVVTQPQHWERFCTALGKPEWIADENLSKGSFRVEHYDEVEKMIEEITMTKATEEWLKIFEENEVAAGPINTVEELFQDPQVRSLELVREMVHSKAGKVKILKQPWTLSATPGGIKYAPPALGEHTTQVLLDRGFSPEEINAFKEKGVIQGL